MGRAHQPREALGAAVGGLGGADVHAVIAPPAGAREFAHGHDLDRGDPELGQRGQMGDRPVEGALGTERADVQLVQDQLGGRRVA